MTRKITIIGAGLTGLTLARRLRGKADITLFEKAQRPGGRLATRTAGGFQFDHGAQYFTIRSSDFRGFLGDALAAGVVAEWAPRIVTLEAGRDAVEETREEPIHVAVPGMNALCAFLAEGLKVTANTEIAACEGEAGAWILTDDAGKRHGPFDWVVSTAPGPQSRELLGERFAARAAIKGARMRGCFSLMLGFAAPLDLVWQGAFVRNSPIGWMALDSSKPGREAGSSLMVQAAGDWADGHLEDPPAEIEASLLKELSELTGIDGGAAIHRDLHRWRFAGTAQSAGEDYLLDVENQLAACGDWCIKGRVEAAFKSADALAGALLSTVIPE